MNYLAYSTLGINSCNFQLASLILNINPLRAKFVRENINIYLHFMSFLHTS